MIMDEVDAQPQLPADIQNVPKNHNNFGSYRVRMNAVSVINLDAWLSTGGPTSVFVGLNLFQFIFVSIVCFTLNFESKNWTSLELLV